MPQAYHQKRNKLRASLHKDHKTVIFNIITICRGKDKQKSVETFHIPRGDSPHHGKNSRNEGIRTVFATGRTDLFTALYRDRCGDPARDGFGKNRYPDVFWKGH